MTAKTATVVAPDAEFLPDARALDVLVETRCRLRVKVGIDPTTSSLHWGHALCLLQAAAFQRAGHEVVLLIGSFTATVGDPSGRNAARPPLALEDSLKHSEHLVGQVLRLLASDETLVVYNHEWLSRYPLASLLSVVSGFTVPQLLSRQSFRDRLNDTRPLAVNEMLYPFLQGLDSIHIGCDVEIGGRDQIPNFALTRKMQRAQGQEPQVGCMLPLIPGTDGAEKMSASDGNAINLDDTPADTFGRVMSIPDAALAGFAPLARLLSADPESDSWPAPLHPMQAKAELARRMIRRMHDEKASRAAQEVFNSRFRRREIPEEAPEVRLESEDATMSLFIALTDADMAASRSEARRLVKQGAIRVDGKQVVDPFLPLSSGQDFVLSRGRRQHVRVRISA